MKYEFVIPNFCINSYMCLFFWIEEGPEVFYTPVERRDVLWNGPVSLSVCPSVRPQLLVNAIS